ncbi:MAG: hypothetical protein AMXMBFR7_30210 [Planctomycetota bacterium]
MAVTDAKADPPRPHGLSRFDRLRATRDFQRAYDAGRAWHGKHVVIFICANELPQIRMGVSVGKKHGGAVRRNRLKRVLRAAFRACRDELPAGYDFVLVPRRGEQILTVESACEELHRMVRRQGWSAPHEAGRK